MFPKQSGTLQDKWRSRLRVALVCGALALILACDAVIATAQVTPMRPADSLKVPPLPDIPRQTPHPEMPSPLGEGTTSRPETTQASFGGGLSYDPSGRRDPFLPIVENSQLGPGDVALPPLQRVGLTELSLIGIVWGTYGYTAMVQAPDGKGYSLRRGTRVGPNNGVVSSITEKGIIVQERFTDVYGNKQEREYVKLLHPKEGIE
jgi:type IV pilus assembly protein PilP